MKNRFRFSDIICLVQVILLVDYNVCKIRNRAVNQGLLDKNNIHKVMHVDKNLINRWYGDVRDKWYFT